MGSYRSKEDEVLKISTSVFVANFLDSFGAKDLWNTCKQYGQVVDAYIPYRRSKAGKRFGFVRFIKRHSSLHNIDGVKRGNSGDTYNSNGVKGAVNSYAHVVKGSQISKMDSDSSPVMVLDDSCLNEKNYSLCLMGKVKDFATLANLKVVVANEGFDNIKFKYMGGYWVIIEFQTEVTKLKFQENSVMKTWFSQIQIASSDFNTDGRVTWVEIDGILLRCGKGFWVRAKEVPGLIPNFVEDNDEEEDSEVGSYEKVPNREDVKNVEDLEGNSDGEIVPDTKFEDDFPNQKGEEDSAGQGNVQSEDHFNIYELLNHKKLVIDKNSNSKESLKYPLGYTPTGSHFKKSEVPKSGGSILQLLDDLVKVGETMGAFVGNSGGILCVWDPNMFKKMNSTVSDYFVMVRGDWIPNDKKLLIILVVINDDFIEVRNKSKRFGTLFNRHGEDVFNRFISNAGSEEVPLEGCSFTWCHRSATKMSKLDHFLISDSLLCSCLDISSITLDRRTEVVNLLQEVKKKNSLEAAQKAKIKWAIEGDKNSKYYHGVINKKRNQLSISGILVKGSFPKGGNYCFIILIPKTPNANMVKDYRLISLSGSMYKIISKILANHLVVVLGGLMNKIQSAFVADKQILDGPFILNKLVQWYKKKKKQSLVFKVDFEKAYDSVRWDHLDDIMRKFGFGEKVVYVDSKLPSDDKVKQVATKIGCNTLKTPFSYLRSKVGGCMSRIQSWNETIERMACRLSKWKLKTLSIGVPKKVLHRMESMRSHFFNGVELSSKKSVWVKWKHALASKDKGGLGVSSLFALNRALMFKWFWHFIAQGSLLWARVIKALHGYDSKIGQKMKSCYPSLWLDIIHEVEMFKSRGMDVSFHHPPRGGVEL
nr:nucleotide-binding alpha-beta plait domain-containing protein [Tanacetum cinerariifolium]